MIGTLVHIAVLVACAGLAGVLARKAWNKFQAYRASKAAAIAQVSSDYGQDKAQTWARGAPFVGMRHELLVSSWTGGRIVKDSVTTAGTYQSLGFQWRTSQKLASPNLGPHYQLRVDLRDGFVTGVSAAADFKRLTPRPIRLPYIPIVLAVASVVLILIGLTALPVAIMAALYPELIALGKKVAGRPNPMPATAAPYPPPTAADYANPNNLPYPISPWQSK